MKTVKLAARFALALTVAFAWVAIAKVGCMCDKATRNAWLAGERFDRVDDAIARLDVAHANLFGNE